MKKLSVPLVCAIFVAIAITNASPPTPQHQSAPPALVIDTSQPIIQQADLSALENIAVRAPQFTEAVAIVTGIEQTIGEQAIIVAHQESGVGVPIARTDHDKTGAATVGQITITGDSGAYEAVPIPIEQAFQVTAQVQRVQIHPLIC